MKKRTEILMISLVLSGAAIAAALTSNYGTEPTDTATVAQPAVEAEVPAVPAESAKTMETGSESSQPDRRGNPVVYDMDIPAEVLSDY